MSSTTFTDRKGRVWDVQLDLLTCEKINASDFSAIPDAPKKGEWSIYDSSKNVFHKLLVDPRFLFAFIWAIVIDQAEAMPRSGGFPISPKEDYEAAELEFISGVNGPVIASARDAVFNALSDFFPERQTVLSALRNHLVKIQAMMKENLGSLEEALQAMMEDDMKAGLEKVKLELAQRESRKTSSTASLPSQE